MKRLPLFIRRNFTVWPTPSTRFRIVTKGWVLKCDRCGRSWHAAANGFEHPGNSLHLLNHIASHEQAEDLAPEDRT